MEEQLAVLMGQRVDALLAELAANRKSLQAVKRQIARGKFAVRVTVTSLWEDEKPATASGDDLESTTARAVEEFQRLNNRSGRQFKISATAVFKDRELAIPETFWQQAAA